MSREVGATKPVPLGAACEVTDGSRYWEGDPAVTDLGAAGHPRRSADLLGRLGDRTWRGKESPGPRNLT